MRYVFELLNKHTNKDIVLSVDNLSDAINFAGEMFKLDIGSVKLSYGGSEVKKYENELSNLTIDFGLDNWVIVRRHIKD